jgi:hypothetical protein
MDNPTTDTTRFKVSVYPEGNGIDYEWDNLDISLAEMYDFLESHNGNRHLRRRIMFVPTSGKNVRIFPEEIIFADTCKNCTTLHLTNGRKLTGICTLSKMKRFLAGMGFLRIHKSYLINTAFISAHFGNVVFLDDGLEFPIGHDYRAEVKSHFCIIGSNSGLYMKKEPLIDKKRML